MLIVVVLLVVILVRGMMGITSVPSKAVLAISLDGPMVEVAADDPLAEAFGTKPLSLRDLRDGLVRAANDDRIEGVRLTLRAFGANLAQVQELRMLLGEISAAGKWTAIYMDTAGEFSPGNIAYYLASACDEISMLGMGDVNLIGLSARPMFLRGTFDKLGISVEFPGRGDYKTARYTYTKREMTDAHREMTEWLLDSYMAQLIDGIATGRGLDPAEVRQLIDRGPFLAQEAVDATLVDHLEDWTAFRERLDGDLEAISLGRYLGSGRPDDSGATVAVVTGVGAIMRGPSGKSLNPLLGGDIMGSETLGQAWRDVRRTPGVKAAVFRVDSPGGSAVASEVIRQEMIRTAEEIPVVVSMSGTAASGGYWISCGAQRIVADPGTLTASIGVFAGHINMAGFYSDKLGITHGRVDRGKHANIYGDLENWNDSHRQEIAKSLDRIYEAFLERAAAARGMTVDEVDAIARGRVFTGEQALERGLVDRLGGFDAALEEARELAGLSPDASVRLVDFPRQVPFWQQLIQRQEERDVHAAVEEVRQTIYTGRAQLPGAVWMPPITIE
jgi:protease-4